MLEGDILSSAEPAAPILDPRGVACELRLEDIQCLWRGARMLPALRDVVQDQCIGQVPVVVEAAGILKHLDVVRSQQVIGRRPAKDRPQEIGHGKAVDHANTLRDIEQDAVHIEDDCIQLASTRFGSGGSVNQWESPRSRADAAWASKPSASAKRATSSAASAAAFLE